MINTPEGKWKAEMKIEIWSKASSAQSVEFPFDVEWNSI